MEIRALRPEDRRDAFRSGQPDIDEFFWRYAGQNQFRHHIGVTYVGLAQDTPVAYFTVAAAQARRTALPPETADRLPAYPVPVLRLARLGVDATSQGTGLGTVMLHALMAIAVEMRARVGCVGILVDSKPETVAFYEERGFRRTPVTSRIAGAGAPPGRLFADLRHLWSAGDPARVDQGPELAFAAEFRRRARELGLTPEQMAAAVDALTRSAP
ncbi:MAG: GNAT family N-acetyltransferase [Coriobacteriia bacterium]|nr:GNAT family N-acetyltransferase [Coriobacteriia bacterium]